MNNLRLVLQTLQDNSLLAKGSKCFFGVQKVKYLGHVISPEGVATDPSKIRAILDWPYLANLKQLRGFLGLIGYYRRFVKDYGKSANL